jgi:hypothetical protein
MVRTTQQFDPIAAVLQCYLLLFDVCSYRAAVCSISGLIFACVVL